MLFQISYAGESILIRSTDTQKMSICICYLGRDNVAIKAVAERIAEDMQASGQFVTSVQYLCNSPASVTDIKYFFKQGHQFVIIVNHSADYCNIEYRCYDTTTGHMIKEASGRYTKRKKGGFGCPSHYIAQKIWPILTGTQGMFTSKIAYSKEVGRYRTIPISHICMADHDGACEQVLVRTPTVNIAPRWGVSNNTVQLFYTEQGPTRARLVYLDEKHKQHPICGAKTESIAMCFAMSPDGKTAAYCASRGDGSSQIYLCRGGNRYNITRNAGNNVSPSFSADGTILYFCSDAHIGRPHIAAYHLDTRQIRTITTKGYCASPAAHPLLAQVAYTKMMPGGDMQIFMYNEDTKQHTQLTYDTGTKDECCWSPCGNYIAYEWRSGWQRMIRVTHVLTGETRTITPPNVRCGYPAWSRCFSACPM
jgi:TolB protein